MQEELTQKAKQKKPMATGAYICIACASWNPTDTKTQTPEQHEQTHEQNQFENR